MHSILIIEIYMADGFNADLPTPPAQEEVPQAEQGERGEASLEEESVQEDVVDAQSAQEELAEIVEAQERDSAETAQELAAIRSKMGIEGQEDVPVSPEDSRLKEAREQIDQISSELAALDQEAFYSEEEMPNAEEYSEKMQIMIDLKDSMEVDQKRDQEDQKEWREKAVEKFIEGAAEWVENNFGNVLSECENGDKVKEYMPKKIEAWVSAVTKDYIEKGIEIDYGFYATLTFKEYNGKDGEKVKVATAFNLDFLDPKADSEVSQDDIKDKEAVLGKDDQQDLAAAEKDGDVDEEKKK